MLIDYTPEQIQEKLARLAEPFQPSDIRWRVTSTSPDKKTGWVAPYADPRAYTARLNEVFGSAGWAFELQTSTTTGLTRMRAGKQVSTGKVTVVATLDIFGISRKASTGEMWADDDNAVTRAEAQAKKRAASMFGLGEYFYRFKDLGNDLRVPLNERGYPTQLPKLPAWALPRNASNTAKRSSNQQPLTATTQGSAPWPVPVQQGSRGAVRTPEQLFSSSRKTRETVLGLDLANNILEQLSAKIQAGELNGDRYALANEKLESAISLLTKVRAAVENYTPQQLENLLDHYNVDDLNSIPTYQVLYRLAIDLGVVPAPAKRAA